MHIQNTLIIYTKNIIVILRIDFMKALVYEEYALDYNYERILKIKEISGPKPKANEVVFKVIATGLNYNDICEIRYFLSK
jgi:D-arabinose 1-dehydrogenase-like Zn-dependent alcohol dehydrogenase